MKRSRANQDDPCSGIAGYDILLPSSVPKLNHEYLHKLNETKELKAGFYRATSDGLFWLKPSPFMKIFIKFLSQDLIDEKEMDYREQVIQFSPSVWDEPPDANHDELPYQYNDPIGLEMGQLVDATLFDLPSDRLTLRRSDSESAFEFVPMKKYRAQTILLVRVWHDEENDDDTYYLPMDSGTGLPQHPIFCCDPDDPSEICFTTHDKSVIIPLSSICENESAIIQFFNTISLEDQSIADVIIYCTAIKEENIMSQIIQYGFLVDCTNNSYVAKPIPPGFVYTIPLMQKNCLL